MKTPIISFLLIFFLTLNLSAHSGKPKYYVLVDTDGALDDMRALSMLFAANDVSVLGISCSQGTLLPQDVYEKVLSLTSAFHHEGIPVGISSSDSCKLPFWSAFAKSISWGASEADCAEPLESKVLFNEVTGNYKDRITLIALGSLKTYANWIKQNPGVKEKIERIIWYNAHDLSEGFNYSLSPESYEFIKKSSIPLEIVSNESNSIVINKDYTGELETSSSVYSRQILFVLAQADTAGLRHREQAELADDLVPLYLTSPILFDNRKDGNTGLVSLSRGMPEDFIFETIAGLLSSSSFTNDRVFRTFPVDPALYKPAYAALMESCIEKYGLIEWKAVVMTNEIHGHTGIYSIIGAKMGIRAMEYFNVGVNNMFVTTQAGSTPPLSCFNDGVQISTGATIGQGLISISDSVSKVPSAFFEFNNRKILICVKKEIAAQMQNDIRYGLKSYGLESEQYWLYIESLALRYWSEYDRYEIFEIREI